MKALSSEGLSFEPEERSPSFTWSRYTQEQMGERLRIIRAQIYLDSLSQRRQPEAGESADAVAKSFAYALDDIPTHHLEEAFRRAIRAKVDDFPLTAAAVNRAYDDMLPELQARARSNADLQYGLLKEGHGSLGYMTLLEWKALHNLPAAWRLGDPIPPESDLYA